MVGFPGEQEQDFRDTLQVLREVGFEGAYTYKYSPRPGTPSWDLATPNGKTVEDRLQEVIAFQRDVTRRRLQEYVGGVEPVLVEKSSRRSPGEWFGLTLTGVPVVFPDPEAVPGDTVTVEILASTGATLIGRRPESSPGVF
jgi:tRNA-2-methylthio-N6-dimethylallyladenosine synthase